LEETEFKTELLVALDRLHQLVAEVERVLRMDRATPEHAMSRREAAMRLKVSVQTVNRLVASGDLPPPRQISRGRVGFLSSELSEYLRSRPAEPIRERTARANASHAKSSERA
jgi:excisionase family DNA binding protein